MTEQQPEMVKDESETGRRASVTYERSPRGTMRGRPVIIAIMPDIPRAVLATGVEHAMAMGSKIVFAHVATDRVPNPSDPDQSHPLDPTAERISNATARSSIQGSLDAFMANYPETESGSSSICLVCRIISLPTSPMTLALGASCWELGVPVSVPVCRSGWTDRWQSSWDAVSCARSLSSHCEARTGISRSVSECRRVWQLRVGRRPTTGTGERFEYGSGLVNLEFRYLAASLLPHFLGSRGVDEGHHESDDDVGPDREPHRRDETSDEDEHVAEYVIACCQPRTSN